MDKTTKYLAAGFFLGKAAKVMLRESINPDTGKDMLGFTLEQSDRTCKIMGGLALLWLLTRPRRS